MRYFFKSNLEAVTALQSRIAPQIQEMGWDSGFVGAVQRHNDGVSARILLEAPVLQLLSEDEAVGICTSTPGWVDFIETVDSSPVVLGTVPGTTMTFRDSGNFVSFIHFIPQSLVASFHVQVLWEDTLLGTILLDGNEEKILSVEQYFETGKSLKLQFISSAPFGTCHCVVRGRIFEFDV